MTKKTTKLDRPIPFTVTDPNAPVPYRVRVETASPDLRAFVVPRLGIRGYVQPQPPPAVRADPPSGRQLQVA